MEEEVVVTSLDAGEQKIEESKKERISQTGTRTRVAWVKATYPNRLDYLGASTPTNSTLFTKPHKHTPLTPPHSAC